MNSSRSIVEYYSLNQKINHVCFLVEEQKDPFRSRREAKVDIQALNSSDF